MQLKFCQDLSADATLSALRRCFASQRTPSTLCFDNGTNFTAVYRPKKSSPKPSAPQLFISLKLQPSTCASLRMRMGTPHPKSEKHNVYAINGSKTLTDNTFNTVLCEIEQFKVARLKSKVS